MEAAFCAERIRCTREEKLECLETYRKRCRYGRTARLQGLLALENLLGTETNPLLREGLMHVVDSWEPELVERELNMATSASGKSTGPLRRATADRLTPPALGRFIEADVTPPQLSGKKPFAVIPYADGSVDVFAGGDMPVRLHSSDGLDWRQETPAWAAPAAEKFGPCVYLDAAPAENGAYYVLAQAESPHLILTQPDGSFREVPIAWTAQPLTVTPLDDGFGFTYAGSAAVDAAGRTAARYGASGGGRKRGRLSGIPRRNRPPARGRIRL